MQPVTLPTEAIASASRRPLAWLLAAAALAAGVLLTNMVLSYRSTRTLREHAAWVEHSLEVITGLERIVSLAKDAETGQRGYLITGEPRYLEPYNTGVGLIDQQVDAVERLTADNPRHQAQFPELRKRIRARLARLEDNIALRTDEGFDASRQLMLTDRGKVEMDALREVIAGMIQQEQDLLQERSRASDQTYRHAVTTGLLSGLAALAALAGFLEMLRRFWKARSEAAYVIAEQAERLRTTLASIGDAVITTDTEGAVTNMNAVAEALTGWTNREAIGQPLEKVFDIVNESTRKVVESPVARALRDGVIVGLANHTVLVAKDGVERPIDDSAAPIRCKVGEIVGCVLVFRDISERHEAEESLRQSERRLRFVMDSMPQKIFTATPGGDVDYFNPVWMQFTGLSFEQIRDWGWTQFIHPDDVAENVRIWRHSIESGEPFKFEHRFRRHDGEYCWHLSRAAPMRNEANEIVMWIGSNTDIHDQKQTAEDLRTLTAQLSEADRRKDEFLATLAHELRNPLAPIRNAMELFSQSEPDEEALRWGRDVIKRQIEHLTRLIDDLLDISRITRNRLELRKQRVTLAEVVQGAVETSQPLIERAGHELTVTLPPEPIFLNADLVRLAQVFMNLLTNAAKYTEDKGRIWLTAERHDGEVVVTVGDTGVGIPADKMPRLFEMFFQVERTLERSQGGLGIGLSLVRRLVEMHGGTVEARSAGHQRGTEFIVRLPVLAEDAKPHGERGGTANGEKKATASRRIAVVDDNADSAETLAKLLRLKGNEVQTANDGLAGVALVEQMRPEVVLMDLGMPKLNGYEACRRIRGESWGQEIVVIALTGWGQDDDRRATEEAGFDEHLVKPINYGELMELLDRLR